MTDRSIRIPSPHQKVPIEQKPWVFCQQNRRGQPTKIVCLFQKQYMQQQNWRFQATRGSFTSSPSAARRRGCVGPEQLHVSGLALSYPGLREPPGGDPICQRGATLLPEAEPAGAHHPSPGEICGHFREDLLDKSAGYPWPRLSSSYPGDGLGIV